jgi:hypothetical protein
VGPVTSTPLLVMVVKPLNARVTRPPGDKARHTCIAASRLESDALAQRPATPKIAMPPEPSALHHDYGRSPIGCQKHSWRRRSSDAENRHTKDALRIAAKGPERVSSRCVQRGFR